MTSLGNKADCHFASDGAARGPRLVHTLHMNLVQHLHEAKQSSGGRNSSPPVIVSLVSKLHSRPLSLPRRFRV